PHFLSHDLFSNGILSGQISISETLRHPTVSGDLELINGELLPTVTRAGANGCSGWIIFIGKSASLDVANISTRDADVSLRGEIDFTDLNALAINVSGSAPMFDMTSRTGIDCVRGIQLLSTPATETMFPKIEELTFHGSIFRPDWTVTLKESMGRQPFGGLVNPDATRTLLFCTGVQPHQETLLLGCEPGLQAEMIRARKPARSQRR